MAKRNAQATEILFNSVTLKTNKYLKLIFSNQKLNIYNVDG